MLGFPKGESAYVGFIHVGEELVLHVDITCVALGQTTIDPLVHTGFVTLNVVGELHVPASL